MLINDAKRMNEESKAMFDEAVKRLEEQRVETATALETLGRLRFETQDGPIRRFVAAFERLKNVETTDLHDGELPPEMQIPTAELREISFEAVDAIKGSIAASGAGAAAGTAAFLAAGAFGTASTGAAISGLAGAAATNATLAWFGGGALAAGGLGVTGGMVVLGGIVALPALAVGGFVLHQMGKKELEKAKANRAEVEAHIEQMETMGAASSAIAKRANRLTEALTRLRGALEPEVGWLEALVEMESDYAKLPEESKQRLFRATTLVLTVRRGIDVALLDEDGGLTDLSAKILDEIRSFKVDAEPSAA